MQKFQILLSSKIKCPNFSYSFTYNQSKIFLILPVTRRHIYNWSPLGVPPRIYCVFKKLDLNPSFGDYSGGGGKPPKLLRTWTVIFSFSRFIFAFLRNPCKCTSMDKEKRLPLDGKIFDVPNALKH